MSKKVAAEKPQAREETPKPQVIDYETAEREYGEGWKELPTRKRNSLAKDAMHHRNYLALCAGIMGFRAAKGK